MKTMLLAGVAALFLATGTTHAQDRMPTESEMCFGENATEVPCAEYGDLVCNDGVDNVYLRARHLISDMSSHTLTIITPTRTARTREGKKRYPVIRYDMETGNVTMDGKRCVANGSSKATPN